ncbi:NADH:flavin oxidoreductase/NADH oxidase [Alpinimonas psychrophila]|uniref:2,4-dienoyl-CoA reductase-like NADH-dependent reductase (Old Yellow Enzyme family) n=1 Tax=Alpinimonas psychrophila TaxID=748908 RepID=A0A7W3JU00_9MICO|nr:NADH:flavin oxidoreductase/NADH oxidase [Alpinimonas psychrophila]MBA8829228.1 2,4-dienoyl-CoA reductase-like NADH-dependent reductase (Old Yellow Enzyme family) [Alpinimonas psychrophila]
MSQPALFTPLAIRNVTFRNRLWVSPMCQYSVVKLDGAPTAWHSVHLGAMAVGGAGLVMTESTAVEAIGRISNRDTGIWNDEQRDAWKPIVDFITAHGAVAGIQLGHAGRKASIYPDWDYPGAQGTMPDQEGGWQTVSASHTAFDGYLPADALTIAQIDALVETWGHAARRSVEAGFRVIELHAAHGYLLHQFLSPLSNERTDAYGGPLENRARLLLRIIEHVRGVIGDDVALFVRVSATDWVDGGWNEAETAKIADWARASGADLFDISSGGNVTGVKIPVGPGYQVPLAHFVKQHSHISTAAVGLVTTPELANSIVENGRSDAVFIGREMLRDPHFALRAAIELGAEIDYWPSQYLRAKPKPSA